MRLQGLVILASFLFSYTSVSLAQQTVKASFGEGIQFDAPDSSFSFNFSARIQNLYSGTLALDGDHYEDNFQVRRARLKFEGFAYHPALEYKLELALSNTDISGGHIPESDHASNIVLDAFVDYNFYGNWHLWFGQAKLPGNRERVVSSQDLQLVDRSNVNAQFNLDRDVGVQLHLNKDKFNFSSAVTIGEGRNIVVENQGGYSYTFRTEYLPFGAFTNEGDYFLSDLEREPYPKLSVGVSWNYNDDTNRSGGQLGDFLPAQSDLTTWFADMIFKYRGWSSLIEFAHRSSSASPLVFDQEGSTVGSFYTGYGFNVQAGYLFKNNIEAAVRYTEVTPEEETLHVSNTEYTFGFSRYFHGHNLKVQTDLSYIEEGLQDEFLRFRMQLEIGI